MDSDLNLVKGLIDNDTFVALLTRVIQDTLTSDFWTITLPNILDTSSARSPALFAYYAAQNILNAPVLFSNKRIPSLLDPALRTSKKALERHHLFPRAWLEKSNITDLKQINQAANFALLEWPDNIDVSDDPPRLYLPKMQARFAPDLWSEMAALHALPVDWEQLSYADFLAQRRDLMAGIVRRGFEALQ